MKKQTFKVGDRVFDHRFGWGEVTYIYTIKKVKDVYNSFDCEVKFDKYKDKKPFIYTTHGALTALSFTEYTLQGFTQEGPINYDDYVGKWGKFTDVSNNNDFVIGRLSSFKVSNDETYFATESGDAYNTFEPLTEEQIKVLGLCD